MDSKRNSGVEVFVCGDVCSHSFSSCNFPESHIRYPAHSRRHRSRHETLPSLDIAYIASVASASAMKVFAIHAVKSTT